MSTLKLGQRSSSAIIGALLQTVFLFFSVQQQDAFKILKRVQVFRKLKLTCYH